MQSKSNNINIVTVNPTLQQSINNALQREEGNAEHNLKAAKFRVSANIAAAINQYLAESNEFFAFKVDEDGGLMISSVELLKLQQYDSGYDAANKRWLKFQENQQIKELLAAKQKQLDEFESTIDTFIDTSYQKHEDVSLVQDLEKKVIEQTDAMIKMVKNELVPVARQAELLPQVSELNHLEAQVVKSPMPQNRLTAIADKLFVKFNNDLDSVVANVADQKATVNDRGNKQGYDELEHLYQLERRNGTRHVLGNALVKTINEHLAEIGVTYITAKVEFYFRDGIGEPKILLDVNKELRDQLRAANASQQSGSDQSTELLTQKLLSSFDDIEQWRDAIGLLNEAVGEYVDNLYEHESLNKLQKLTRSRSRVLSAIAGTVGAASSIGVAAVGLVLWQMQPGSEYCLALGIIGSVVLVSITTTLAMLIIDQPTIEVKEAANIIRKELQLTGALLPVGTVTPQQADQVRQELQQQADNAKVVHDDTMKVMTMLRERIELSKPLEKRPNRMSASKQLSAEDRMVEQGGRKLVDGIDKALGKGIKQLRNFSIYELKENREHPEANHALKEKIQAAKQAFKSGIQGVFLQLPQKEMHIFPAYYSSSHTFAVQDVDQELNRNVENLILGKMLNSGTLQEAEAYRTRLLKDPQIKEQRAALEAATKNLNEAVDRAWEDIMDAMIYQRYKFDDAAVRGDILAATTITLGAVGSLGAAAVGVVMVYSSLSLVPIDSPASQLLVVFGMFVVMAGIMGITITTGMGIEMNNDAADRNELNLNDHTIQAFIETLGRDTVANAMAAPEGQRMSALNKAAEGAINNLAKLDITMQKVVDAAIAYDHSKANALQSR